MGGRLGDAGGHTTLTGMRSVNLAGLLHKWALNGVAMPKRKYDSKELLCTNHLSPHAVLDISIWRSLFDVEQRFF